MRVVFVALIAAASTSCATLVESACKSAGPTPEKADECMAVRGVEPHPGYFKERAAERKAERERIAAEEDAELADAEQAKRDRCAAEIKQYGGEFWQCMNFYEARERREEDIEREADANAAARAQQKADRDAAIWSQGIRDMGNALTPKTTTCTTQPDYMGGVRTVCH